MKNTSLPWDVLLFVTFSRDFTIKLQKALIKVTTLIKDPYLHVFISYKPLQCTQGTSNILLISKDRFVKMIHCRILACTQRRRKVHTYVPTIQKCNRPVSTHSVIKISSIHPYNHIHHKKSLKIIPESSWMNTPICPLPKWDLLTQASCSCQFINLHLFEIKYGARIIQPSH